MNTVRLDRIFREVKELVPAEELVLLTPSVVHGVVPQSSLGMRPQQAFRQGYSLAPAQPNDFVISLSSHAHGIEWCGLYGGVSPDYTLLRPIVDARYSMYLKYALKSQFMISQLGLFKTGIRMGLRLQWSKVRYCKIELPPLAAAVELASHLDRATNHIDALITKKTRFIELLREKRQALITHAVTKGLHAGMPMKYSGVEWLGEVPAHWIVGRLRDFTTSISTGPFGTALGTADYVSGGIPVINPSHIDEGGCSPDEAVSVSKATAMRLLPWQMRTGDVVTARRGELGRSAVIREAESGWICGTGSLRLRPNSSQASSAFLHAVLQSVSARSWLEYQSVGSTMPNLSEAIIGCLPIAMPPSISEQDSLLSDLTRRNQKIDTLIAKTERSIELLREHRTALITAAVTGKIELRNAA